MALPMTPIRRMKSYYKPNTDVGSYVVESEQAIDQLWDDRRQEDRIPLLIGGTIEIEYLAPEKVESPWDDDSHNGPQAA